MDKIVSELTIPLGPTKGIYSESTIKISIDDEGSGPYLVVRGENDEPTERETGHEFFLCSCNEIDEFAEICKEMLRQAEITQCHEFPPYIIGVD